LELPLALELPLEPEPDPEPPFFAIARPVPRVMAAVSAQVTSAPVVVLRSRVDMLKDDIGFSNG
jgi:hypothetical protein